MSHVLASQRLRDPQPPLISGFGLVCKRPWRSKDCEMGQTGGALERTESAECRPRSVEGRPLRARDRSSRSCAFDPSGAVRRASRSFPPRPHRSGRPRVGGGPSKRVAVGVLVAGQAGWVPARRHAACHIGAGSRNDALMGSHRDSGSRGWTGRSRRGSPLELVSVGAPRR
jgi:hypothetical protein